MKDGLLIAIEGIDGSGKATLQRRLQRRLEAEGRTVHLLDFPDYETPIGGAIRSFLAGETSLNRSARQLLYAANRFERRDRIEGWLADGAVVVCDRYTPSGLAYGLAQGVNREWMEAVEAPLPAPHFVLLLEVSVETSARRTGRRDRYEKDDAFLEACRSVYGSLAAEDPDRWHRIDGEASPDAVAEAAWSWLEERLT